jgi:hypothetical protein
LYFWQHGLFTGIRKAEKVRAAETAVPATADAAVLYQKIPRSIKYKTDTREDPDLTGLLFFGILM